MPKKIRKEEQKQINELNKLIKSCENFLEIGKQIGTNSIDPKVYDHVAELLKEAKSMKSFYEGNL